MNSPKTLNYETRPVKFTERRMLLASIHRICNYFGSDFQYIGLGGLTFADFKLFHKELHIKELYSIEGGNFSFQKLQFNSPYSFIKIIPKFSTLALNEIPLDKRTLIWLDYDGALDNYMFDDLTILFSKLPKGSIYIVTCNRELKDGETNVEYIKETFKAKFGNLIPYELENLAFSSENNYKTIRSMFLNHLRTILNERSKVETPISFYQLYNLTYNENQGARMYTFGGVLASEDFEISNLNLSQFDFVNTEETPYKIDIPNLTRKEVELINNYMIVNEEQLLGFKIITKSELEKHKRFYKYIPHFYDVRL